MRFASLFQRQPRVPSTAASAPALDHTAAWRRGPCKVYPLGEETQAVLARHRAPSVLPAFAVEFAQECRQFQPLIRHVAEYAEKHGWDALQVEALWREMPALAEAGLLISTTELEQRCTAAFLNAEPPPPLIRALGFPTGGDRTALLERGIRSFAENLRTHGRQADLLVSDNSPRAEQRDRCREMLGAIGREFGLPAFFAGEEEKRRFAGALARTGACAPAVAEFALLDPLGIGFACGANRNALLLHEAGGLFCSTDDDAICRLAAPPVASAAPLACFSDTDPLSRWLFADRESALASARWIERDYLALHETMLGRGLGTIASDAGVRGGIDFSEARDEFLARLEAGQARVRATFTGQIGDPGIPSSVYYLFYHGENRRRLTESEAHYRSVFPSRSVLSMIPQNAVGDASVSPGIAMAMDGREELPPFFPVLHAEDFTWGAALWQCCPEALLGHVPAAVLHAAPPGKSILLPGAPGSAPRAVVSEFAHLLRRLLLDCESPISADAGTRMRLLGRTLGDHATLPSRDWEDFLRQHTLTSASEQTEYLSRQLEEAEEDAPDFWRRDVAVLIAQMREALASADFDVPQDLRETRPAAETRALMQRLIREYAALLQAWPDIWQAARELRERGQGLMQPCDQAR